MTPATAGRSGSRKTIRYRINACCSGPFALACLREGETNRLHGAGRCCIFPDTGPGDPLDLWRNLRTALTTTNGYFEQIKDCVVPLRFDGRVVSQPGPKELIVNVDDPAGDAELRLTRGAKAQLAAGASIHFQGVVRTFTAHPYRLTLKYGRSTSTPTKAHRDESRNTGRTHLADYPQSRSPIAGC